MENNDNLPKKPSRWQQLFNPNAMEQYNKQMEEMYKKRDEELDRRLLGVSQRETQVSSKEQSLKEWEDRLENRRRELMSLQTSLGRWKAYLADEKTGLENETQRNSSLKAALQEQEKELNAINQALQNWQRTLVEMQDMSDVDKMTKIAEVRQQMEIAEAEHKDRELLLRNALNTITKETLPERDKKIAELEEIINGLTDQIRDLQAEQSKAISNAEEQTRNARQAKEENEELRKRLKSILGAYKEEGILHEKKDEAALVLENEFKGCLIQYEQEYEADKAYEVGSKKRKEENEAIFKAKCLGALAAYADMDPNKKSSRDIRLEIKKAARTECAKYAHTIEHPEEKKDFDYNMMMKSRQFMETFVDAFMERRFEPGYLKWLGENGRKEVKKMIIEANSDERKLIEKYKGIRRQPKYTSYSDSIPFDNWIGKEIQVPMQDIRVKMGRWTRGNGMDLREGHTYAPDLPRILNENETYKKIEGTEIKEPGQYKEKPEGKGRE